MEVRPDDERLRWEGAVSLQRTAEWVMPWRVPYELRRLFPEALNERAAMPAGVRLTFQSDTTSIAGTVEPDSEAAPVDLCVDGDIVGSVPLAGQSTFRFDGLPRRTKLIELWLPQGGTFRLRGLTLSEDAGLTGGRGQAPPVDRVRQLDHALPGAASPTQTWPAVVARERGLHLTCLGYGSNCQLDTMVARMIRDLPADYLTMKVGINVYSVNGLSPRTFRPAIIGFVQIVRERHPDTPFAVVSSILSRPREDTPNAVGFTLRTMRDEVAEAVAALRAHGDRHVHYIDGLRIMGPEQADLIPGDAHPSAEGYVVMGRRFLEHVARELFV